MGDVVNFRARADAPDDVLEDAKGVFRDVMVIGWGEDDLLRVYISPAFELSKEAVWLLECVKQNILENRGAT